MLHNVVLQGVDVLFHTRCPHVDRTHLLQETDVEHYSLEMKEYKRYRKKLTIKCSNIPGCVWIGFYLFFRYGGAVPEKPSLSSSTVLLSGLKT